MEKCKDEDILNKSAEYYHNQGRPRITDLKDFRRQFYEYQRTKSGGELRARTVCRPYMEIFHHRQKGKKS